MTTGWVLVLVLGTSPDETSASTKLALRDALGPDVSVEVRTVDHLLRDEDAVAEAHDEGLRAIAEVTWTSTSPSHVTVHAFLPQTGAWADREIVFSTHDAPAERARTLGFAIASMLPPASSAPPRPEASEPPPALTATPPPSPSSPPTAPAHVEPPPAPPPERPTLGAVELALAAAVGGQAGGIGVEVAGERRFGPWSPRLELGWRTGDIPAAQVRTFVVSAAPGIAWRPIEPSDHAPFGFGVRAAYLLEHEALTRPVDGATPPAQWQSGAQAMVEGVWEFARGALVVVSAGGEVTFGTLDVVVAGRTVASIEPARALFECGIRTRF